MDIVVNAGVIVVLMAMKAGAPGWADPAFAFLIAVYLGVTAKDIAKSGLDMLLDRELPGETRAQIIDIITAQPGVLGVHDLRTGQSGMRVVMSFDIEADPDLTLLAAHEIARGVEGALLERFPHADIMIHVDPHGDTDDSRHVVERVHGAPGGAA
jgi:ferrous-iron efflux pump FieF